MTINKQACDKMKSAAAKAVDNFDPNMFVETRDVLALLDELEAAERRNAELSQKADIYDMLCEDYEIKGSLVDFVDWQVKRIAELEARELIVKLPAYVDGRTLGYGEVNHMIDLCADAIEKACHAAGIITKVGE